MQAEGLGHRLARQIILGWTQAAAEKQYVRPRHRGLSNAHNVFEVVADDCLESNFHSQTVQFFGEIKRVGVLPERSQHLRAHRDDLGIHNGSLNEITAMTALSKVGPAHPKQDDR